MRSTATGWVPMRGDLVDVWVAPPTAVDAQTPASVKWGAAAWVVGADDGVGAGPRWVVEDMFGGRHYVPQAESSLHAVEDARVPQGVLR